LRFGCHAACCNELGGFEAFSDDFLT
jgi:hypothetical protein